MKSNLSIFLSLALTVLFSINASAQWVDASSGNDPYSASDIGFFKSKTGISLNMAMNGSPDVRRTTNGGQSWSTVDMSKLISPFNAISTVSTTIGYAGGKQLIKTTDGGATWDSVSNMSFTGVGRSQVSIESMLFTSELTGFVVLSNMGYIIYKTTDGGKTWANSKGINFSLFGGFFALDANNIYAINNNSSIEYTNDGGTTWNAIPSTSFGNSVYGVTFLDAHTGYVIGGNATVYKTMDNGSTWASTTLDTSVNLFGVQFIDANNGIIYGEGEIVFLTTNGGTTWKHYYKDDPNRIFRYDLQKAYFFDMKTGAAIGQTGASTVLLANTNLDNNKHTTGIRNSNSSNIEINVYPNPSTGIVNITCNEMEGNGLVSVYNSAGKLIYSNIIEANSKSTISVSGLSKGLYIVKVTTQDATGYQQVIVE